jgi:hypothetical protein
MRSILRAAVVSLLAVGSLTAAMSSLSPAHADTLLCAQFASTTIQGRYVVQNNRWGTSATQCINVTSTGFQVTQADGSTATNGAPKSYPSVFFGCHYTNCSPGTNLPMRISSIGSVNSSISYNFVGNATYDAAYDIWLDPTPRTNGVNQTEIMIWLNRVGPVQPVGSQVGTGTVGGRSWSVWTGNNGSNNVISFVAAAPIASSSFNIMDFVNQAISRGLATNAWFLTSIQAGFEPWQGGVGLAVNSFSATVNAGGGGGGGTVSCRVTYTPNSWPGGFTADVTVANTGSTPINGWTLAYTLPSGQAITSQWNAVVTPTSGALTARDLGANSAIAANGGTQSFGYQGTYTGAFSRPTAFSLNGTACSVA